MTRRTTKFGSFNEQASSKAPRTCKTKECKRKTTIGAKCWKCRSNSKLRKLTDEDKRLLAMSEEDK